MRMETNPQSSDALAGLSEEQRKAALHILNSRDHRDRRRWWSRDRQNAHDADVNAVMSGLRRGPGDYSKVFAFAPSSQASRGVLAKEGFKDAETLAMLLRNRKASGE